MADGVDIVAAVAACVAAGVVGWQSWETRKSAEASRKAAETAARGLDTANEALDVARTEEGHSRVLVAETQRARIDAAFPAISVTPQETPLWPPVTTSGSTYGPWEWNRCELDKTWSMPADAGEALGIVGKVRIHNGAPTVVQVHVFYTDQEGNRVNRAMVLDPGQTEYLVFLAWASISQWAKGDPSEDPLFEWGAQPASVSYGDQRDSGGSISWQIGIRGPLIFQADETKKQRYSLAGTTPSPGIPSHDIPTIYTVREYRTYWLSRPDGIELKYPL
ncbi:hypothetical protein [Cellulosimicrobium funkei]|uniref:hypothetical protein n=1 Tax=Cellulosimicrobium funkei TaxID=264251 RepID=UPI003697C4B5